MFIRKRARRGSETIADYEIYLIDRLIESLSRVSPEMAEVAALLVDDLAGGRRLKRGPAHTYTIRPSYLQARNRPRQEPLRGDMLTRVGRTSSAPGSGFLPPTQGFGWAS